jgi:glycosyltransferase involved in cell wall biosynthesis
MVKVSVIMSVYNCEKYLRETIDSVLNQTLKDFEFIIVNDGSTDNTREILESYSDGRMHIVNQRNLGISRAKNRAIALSSGEYVAIIDADDIWLPEKLEKQVNFLDEHSDIGLVGTATSVIDKKKRIMGTLRIVESNEAIQDALLKDNCFSHSSIMLRKSIFEKVDYYNEEFDYSLDYDLLLRISEHCRVWNLSEVLTIWRFNEEGVSVCKHSNQMRYALLARVLAENRRNARDENLLANKARIIGRAGRSSYKYSPFIQSILDAWNKSLLLSKAYYGSGCFCLKKGDMRLARQFYFSSLRCNFLYIKSYICLFLSIFPLRIIRILYSVNNINTFLINF